MLNVNWIQIGLTIFNLLVLYLLAKKFLFGRVDAILMQRREEVDSATKAADAAQQEALETKKEYEEKIAHVDEEKEQILGDIKKQGYAEYERIVNDARKKGDQIIVEAKHNAQIEAQREKDAYVSELTDLVVHAANKIAVSKHDEESDKELYNKFIFEAIEKSN